MEFSELSDLPLQELIHLRYHKYKMSGKAGPLRNEIDTILSLRSAEFTDEDLAFFISVLPTSPSYGSSTFNLYNKLVSSLPDDHPYRYRFIINKHLSHTNRDLEFIRWAKGKENARYFGVNWNYLIARAIFDDTGSPFTKKSGVIKRLAEALLKKKSKLSCFILTRPELNNDLIIPALKYVNSLSDPDFYLFKLMVDKDLLSIMTNKTKARFLKKAVVRGCLPTSQIIIDEDELKRQLFQLSTLTEFHYTVKEIIQAFKERKEDIQENRLYSVSTFTSQNRKPRRLNP